jgi:hypothetical protein
VIFVKNLEVRNWIISDYIPDLTSFFISCRHRHGLPGWKSCSCSDSLLCDSSRTFLDPRFLLDPPRGSLFSVLDFTFTSGRCSSMSQIILGINRAIKGLESRILGCGFQFIAWLFPQTWPFHLWLPS